MRLIALALLSLIWLQPASAATIATVDFLYTNPDVDGDLWGTMTLEVIDADTIAVTYSGLQPDAQGDVTYDVTGFGFEFTSGFTYSSFDVSNDPDPDASWVWQSMDPSTGGKPQPTNGIGSEVTQGSTYVDIKVGETCGDVWNVCGNTFGPGDTDTYYLNFVSAGDLTTMDIAGIFDFAFVRMQAVALCTAYDDNGGCTNWDENAINEGSLFLGGSLNPIPLPPAVWLLGTALLGLVGFGRSKPV